MILTYRKEHFDYKKWICIPVCLFVLIPLGACRTSVGREDPLQYVDPFICTARDCGQLYPGASYPFGLVQLSPETESDSHVGYYYEDEFIEGFSHLRIAGAGSQGKGGGILIKPGIGRYTNKRDEFREEYDKASEEAFPGYYKVVLRSGVKAELTVSERVGFHRYTFPEGQKKDRYVVIDLSHSYVGIIDAHLNVKNNREITGKIKSLHNKGGGYHIMYFAVVADSPFKSFISWEGDKKGEITNCKGNNIGVWLNLPEDGNDVLQLKVGLSPVSEEHAMMEATNEIVGWDFETARNTTASVWRDKLSKVEVKGGSDEFKTLLYTHLYHSYLVPCNATASNGDYRAANQPDSLFNTKATAPDFTYYCMWSLWDDFRKYSLVSLLEPQISKNIARSLVDYYKHREGGDRKYWPTPNIRMEFVGAVIMDAFNKGLGDFDTLAAFKGMKEDYLKYGEKNVSSKLEKACHAYLAMKMAEAIGESNEAKELRKGALAYRQMWCPEQKDNQGNIRGFFTPDGDPVADVEEFEKYVYEGNLWHYRWFVLHDVAGLAESRGGKELLADDLEYFFENNFYMHVNEPDIHAPFMFDFLGKPYLTQKWARTFTTKEVVQLYHNHGLYEKPMVRRIYLPAPEGYLLTMDDDAGAMSSWFVMSAIGLFPFDPAEPYYLIGSPIFPEITLHLDNGRDFKIVARNVNEENFYIQSAKLNGEKYDKPWIEYETLMNGGLLEFEMGPEPNKAWGSDPKNAPPSMSKCKIKDFYVGVDNSGDKFGQAGFFNGEAMDTLGVDFVVYKYRGPTGTIQDEAEKLERVAESFEEKNLPIVINVETGNWSLDKISKDGYNWVRQPGNLHLFKFPPQVIKSLNRSPVVWGIMYDELEHSQITRNLSITLKNPGVEMVSLAETTGMDFKTADKAVYEGAKSLVDECRLYGTRKVLAEHVWPVLFHNFARADLTPAYKQMKENWSNVMAACAMGACLQYNKELWACLDLWHHNTFPGHSAEELWGNLLFAYWVGTDKAYVENVGALYDINGSGNIELTEWGKVYRSFAKKYVAENSRPYTFRDFEPEIAIIRFDDTEWGQGEDVYCTVEDENGEIDLHWRDWLFGAYDLHSRPESKEWISAWHTITHGMVNKESLSWNAGNYYGDIPHRSFAPANSPVVFDERVTKEYLEKVKLAFLCGLYLSERTLADVSSLVRENGLVAVTSHRFAPRKFSDAYINGTKVFEDGKGKWIITDDMAGDDVKKLVKPFLGKEDEISYKFKGNRIVTMKISADGNSLKILKTNF